MSNLVTYQNGVKVGTFLLGPIGLSITDQPTFDEWEEFGRFLQQAERGVQFWIGDWLIYGEQAWGEMYSQAIEITGYEYQTLRDCKWVAGSVTIERRRSELGFAHHKAVAGLTAENQDKYLQLAVENGWSVRELQAAFKGEAMPEYPALAAITEEQVEKLRAEIDNYKRQGLILYRWLVMKDLTAEDRFQEAKNFWQGEWMKEG